MNNNSLINKTLYDNEKRKNLLLELNNVVQDMKKNNYCSNVSTSPVSNVSTLPVANVSTSPVANVSTLPVANVSTLPVGNVTTFPVANVSTSPIGSIVSTPPPIVPINAVTGQPIITPRKDSYLSNFIIKRPLPQVGRNFMYSLGHMNDVIRNVVNEINSYDDILYRKSVPISIIEPQLNDEKTLKEELEECIINN